MKGDPSKFMIKRFTDSIFKIKDYSRFKCHKEMKETLFSLSFIDLKLVIVLLRGVLGLVA